MDELQEQVRRAHRRLGTQRFVDSLGWCVTAALVVGLVLVVLGKFWSLGLPLWVWPTVALGLGVAAAMVWSLATRPAPLEAAVEIDRRFALRERVSTALALSPAQRESGPGQAILEDAARRVGRLDVASRFKMRTGRQLLLPLAPAAAVLLAALLIPESDGGSTAQAKAEATAVEEQVKRSSDDLARRLAEKRKQAEQQTLSEESRQLLKKLEEGSKELTRQTNRKDALVKLRDLSQQLQERRQQLGGAEQVKQQLNQLKAGPKGPAEKFAQDVGRGDFNKALQELEKLREQVADNKLDQAQRDQLAKQLDQMQRKLQDLAAAHQAAQEELRKQIDAASKAGQTAEANCLQQQLDKLAMQTPQMQQLCDLGQKLGQCSQCLRQGQSGKACQAMQDARASLAQMQRQLDELQMLDGAMAELDQTREQMTCSKCGGAGCKACQGGRSGEGPGQFMEGDRQGTTFQAGPGGLGQGGGARPERKNNTAFYDSQVKQQPGKGTSTAAGTTGGPNVKGNVFQEIQQRAETAKHGEVDPLTDQRMPREHREHAREYFDRLRKGE